MRGLIEDVDLLEAVALAHREVVGIVRGRDLHEAGAEIGIDVKVAENRDFPVHDRQHDGLADELVLVMVFRGNRDAGVAEHGLGTRGCDHDVFLAVDRLGQRIAEVPQMAVLLLVLRLVVGNGGTAVRAPVDDALAAIDQGHRDTSPRKSYARLWRNPRPW